MEALDAVPRPAETHTPVVLSRTLQTLSQLLAVLEVLAWVAWVAWAA
jgi:hypothetical protein